MNRLLIVAPLLFLAPVTGCSGGTAATSTPSPSTATVAQYASVISKNSPDVTKSAADINDCFIHGDPFSADRKTVECALAPLTAGSVARVLLKDLSALQPAPQEIAELAATTTKAAAEASVAANTVEVTCSIKTCNGANYLALLGAMGRLDAQMRAWRPYGA